MDLDAHLRDDLRLARGGGNLPGFVNRVRQRLLAVNVLAALNGRHADGGVHVVRGGNAHGVDRLVDLIQQFSPIGECLRTGKASGGPIPIAFVNIADGNHIDRPTGEGADVATTLTADPNRGQVQLLARRRMTVTA